MGASRGGSGAGRGAVSGRGEGRVYDQERDAIAAPVPCANVVNESLALEVFSAAYARFGFTRIPTASP